MVATIETAPVHKKSRRVRESDLGKQSDSGNSADAHRLDVFHSAGLLQLPSLSKIPSFYSDAKTDSWLDALKLLMEFGWLNTKPSEQESIQKYALRATQKALSKNYKILLGRYQMSWTVEDGVHQLNLLPAIEMEICFHMSMARKYCQQLQTQYPNRPNLEMVLYWLVNFACKDQRWGDCFGPMEAAEHIEESTWCGDYQDFIETVKSEGRLADVMALGLTKEQFDEDFGKFFLQKMDLPEIESALAAWSDVAAIEPLNHAQKLAMQLQAQVNRDLGLGSVFNCDDCGRKHVYAIFWSGNEGHYLDELNENLMDSCEEIEPLLSVQILSENEFGLRYLFLELPEHLLMVEDLLHCVSNFGATCQLK